MDNKTPANACHRCGATAYRPVIARDASGAMTPSGAYRCVRCKLEFTSIDQWRCTAGPANSADAWTQGRSAAWAARITCPNSRFKASTGC